MGYSPWGGKELDMTEHIGEGNGNPLQCSCLELMRGLKDVLSEKLGTLAPYLGLVLVGPHISEYSSQQECNPPYLPTLEALL